MKVCAFAVLLWRVASERDDESFMLQRKHTSSLAADPDDNTLAANPDEYGWGLKGTMVISNLGGINGTSRSAYNPDTIPQGDEEMPTPVDAAREMRFYKVGMVNGHMADLRLINLTEYTPNAPKPTKKKPLFEENNGREGAYGQINVKAGTNVTIQFSLVKTGTDEVIPPCDTTKNNFTVVDFDRSETRNNKKVPRKLQGLSIEMVLAKDYHNKDDTRLPASDEDFTDVDGTVWDVFEAPEDARETEYPGDVPPDQLSDKKLESTLSLTYTTNVWEVMFKVEVEDHGTGRNFLFTGDSSGCEILPKCMCTPDEGRRNPVRMPNQAHYMRWALCGDDKGQRKDERGGDEPVAGGGHVLRYPNVAKLAAEAGTMKLGEQSVDLIVDNMTEYVADDLSRNGRNVCLGVINVASPGEVTMQFTLVLSGTDTPVPVDTTLPLTYDFNIFDFDQSAKGGMQEVVGVRDFSKLVADSPGIERTEDDLGNTWLRALTKAVKNPNTSIRAALTDEQLLSSFSVSYRAVSSWNVTLKAEKKGSRRGKLGGRNFLFSGESCASWRFHECSCPTNKRKYRTRRHDLKR